MTIGFGEIMTVWRERRAADAFRNQREDSSPRGELNAAERRCLGSARRLVALPDEIFSPHVRPAGPKFHYLYLLFGSNKALLPPLDICHPAGEQSCCHSTSADLKWCSEKIKVTLCGGRAAPAVTQSFVRPAAVGRTPFLFFSPPPAPLGRLCFITAISTSSSPSLPLRLHQRFQPDRGKKHIIDTWGRQLKRFVTDIFIMWEKKGREGLQPNDTQQSYKKSFL